jgi:hypothetical protein
VNIILDWIAFFFLRSAFPISKWAGKRVESWVAGAAQ